MTRRINMARWQPHVEEARRRGGSLKAYAAEQGLSLYSLYRASQALREGGAIETGAPSERKFAAVRVVGAPGSRHAEMTAAFNCASCLRRMRTCDVCDRIAVHLFFDGQHRHWRVTPEHGGMAGRSPYTSALLLSVASLDSRM